MADIHHERELKFETAEDFAMPDLTGVLPGSAVIFETVELSADYYDTADRHDAGSNGFALGVLYAREERATAGTRRRLAKTYASSSGKT